MKRSVAIVLFALSACDSSDDDPSSMDAAVADAATGDDASVGTVLDLGDLTAHPDDYAWFDFRPNVKKLILAGAAETEHIAILWYTTDDGGVGLHYHAKTESVYVIDGTQTDAKGVYPTGTVYYNPPGSGHQITESSGFFLLAYAAPPDFMGTDMIEEYEPVRIEAKDPELTRTYAFDEVADGVRVFTPELASSGGMSAAFLEITSSTDYDFEGNYLLVLDGFCEIEGEAFGEDTLVVANSVEPKHYKVTAFDEGSCLALGVSF